MAVHSITRNNDQFFFNKASFLCWWFQIINRYALCYNGIINFVYIADHIGSVARLLPPPANSPGWYKYLKFAYGQIRVSTFLVTIGGAFFVSPFIALITSCNLLTHFLLRLCWFCSIFCKLITKQSLSQISITSRYHTLVSVYFSSTSSYSNDVLVHQLCHSTHKLSTRVNL